MADTQPLYSTDVDQWLLENFPTAKGAKDAYDAFSTYLYGSEVDDHEDGDNDAKCGSSDEEDRKAVELALTWHATSHPPPLLERYLGLGLRHSSATYEPRPAAAASDVIIPTHGISSTRRTADVAPFTPTLLDRMSCGNSAKPEWRSSSRTDQREEGSASSTADVPPSTATLLERMSCGPPFKLEWRSTSRINQREEFLRRTARGHTPSVLQELPTNRPSVRNLKDAKTYNDTGGGSRGPPPSTASSYRQSDYSVSDHGPGRDLRYDQPRRGGGPERSDSTARHMPPRCPYAAAHKDTPQPPRRPTSATAPSAPPSLPPAQASPVPAAQDDQRVSTSQPLEAPFVQSPTTPDSYLLLATDPTSRPLMARIYKLVAIAYMYRAGSVRMQLVINALCVAYQATVPASEPEVPFNPPPEWHEALLANFAERDVAYELFEMISEVEKAIEEGVQPPPLRKYIVVALILYIEHLIEFGAETIEQMKDWPRDP